MEKLEPTLLIPQFRQQLSIDALTKFVDNSAGGHVTDFQISNIQITYQLLDFGSELQNRTLSMPELLIKSNGWSSSATTLNQGLVGSRIINL